MEYIDERIMALRHKKAFNAGIKAEEKVELFFDGLIAMVLPDNFSDMKEERIKKLFLADKLPDYVKTTGKEELIMSLEMLTSHAQLEEVLEQCQQMIKIMYPGSVIYEKGVIDELTGWFDCKIFMGKEIYYKLYFVVEKDEKNVFGNFQCRFENYDRWKLQMINILHGIS